MSDRFTQSGLPALEGALRDINDGREPQYPTKEKE